MFNATPYFLVPLYHVCEYRARLTHNTAKNLDAETLQTDRFTYMLRGLSSPFANLR